MAPRYSRGYHPGYSMVSPLLLVLYGYGPYRCIPVPGSLSRETTIPGTAIPIPLGIQPPRE